MAAALAKLSAVKLASLQQKESQTDLHRWMSVYTLLKYVIGSFELDSKVVITESIEY